MGQLSSSENFHVSDNTVDHIINNSVSENTDCYNCLQVFSSNAQYTNYVLNAHFQLQQSALPNFMGLRIPVISTWNLEFLDSILHDYHDRQILQYLRYGFPINFQGQIGTYSEPPNHGGARRHPDAVRQYLGNEARNHTLVGPFHNMPFTEAIISPLNTRDKKDSVEKRILIDLSLDTPDRQSVNSQINMDEYFGVQMTLTYPSIDNLVDFIIEVGPGALLYKRDLKKAYKLIPVDYRDINLLGYKFDDHYYFDTTLPMGLSSSAYICQRTTNMLRHVGTQMGLLLCNYLDDFAGVSPSARAVADFLALGRLLKNAGAEENETKAIVPTTKMPFVGITANTIDMTLSIPPEKLQEVFETLSDWIGKTTMTRKELESLIGKLSFVAQCVRPGRIFIARLLEALRGLPRKGRFPVTEELLKDVIWWQRFAPEFHGISLIPENNWTEPNYFMSCDATLVACGGWSDHGEYFREKFPQSILSQKLHISALEMITLTVTTKLWIHRFQSTRLQIYSDNLATVLAVNTGKSRDPTINSCLRELVYVLAINNSEMKARHISTKNNTFSDMLSRWNEGEHIKTKFQEMTKDLRVVRVRVPKSLFTKFNYW